MVAPTQILQLLVVQPRLQLLMELVLVGAQLQQILAGLVAVRLEQVLDPVRRVLKADLLFLQGDRGFCRAAARVLCVRARLRVMRQRTLKEIFLVSLQGNRSTGVRFPLRTSKMSTPLQKTPSMMPVWDLFSGSTRWKWTPYSVSFWQTFNTLNVHMLDTQENKQQVKVSQRNSRLAKQLTMRHFLC